MEKVVFNVILQVWRLQLQSNLPRSKQYKLWNSNPKLPSHLCSFHYVIQLIFFSESCLNQKEMKLGYISFLISLFCATQSYSIDQVTSVEQLTTLQTVH